MALSLRGVAEATGTSSAIITHPGGIAENDVVFAAEAVGSITVNRDMTAVTAGYTELADLYANDTLDCNFAVFRKVMGATPDSTVELSNSVGTGRTNAVEQVWTGADITTPEDATTTTATGINSSVPDSPSITTVTANAIVIAVGAGTSVNGDAAVTAPTGYSNQVDITFDSAGNSATIGMASKSVASPGAEDPAAWTNWTTTANDSWCAATVAVRPAAAAGSRSQGHVFG